MRSRVDRTLLALTRRALVIVAGVRRNAQLLGEIDAEQVTYEVRHRRKANALLAKSNATARARLGSPTGTQLARLSHMQVMNGKARSPGSWRHWAQDSMVPRYRCAQPRTPLRVSQAGLCRHRRDSRHSRRTQRGPEAAQQTLHSGATPADPPDDRRPIE